MNKLYIYIYVIMILNCLRSRICLDIGFRDMISCKTTSGTLASI
ncbi:hypothetical protein F383_27598 [Gossypium arboreum]|uniref:Uncharacterized protein n=1 Tax=Gossypium arboreum TaxID=29729 RepID=A0A0B0PAC3_GOSAR|nr:hypothetical protein F383_27598 [Gossypium arboreum]